MSRSKKILSWLLLVSLPALTLSVLATAQFLLSHPDVFRHLAAWWAGAEYLGEQDVVRQHNPYECGLACLKAALRFKGVQTSIEELRRRARTGRHGTSLLELKRAAESYGFRVELWRYTFSDLAAATPPVIAFVDGHHFVTVVKITPRHGVIVLDPARGRLRYGRAAFLEHWKGESLSFAHSGAHQPAATASGPAALHRSGSPLQRGRPDPAGHNPSPGVLSREGALPSHGSGDPVWPDRHPALPPTQIDFSSRRRKAASAAPGALERAEETRANGSLTKSNRGEDELRRTITGGNRDETHTLSLAHHEHAGDGLTGGRSNSLPPAPGLDQLDQRATLACGCGRHCGRGDLGGLPHRRRLRRGNRCRRQQCCHRGSITSSLLLFDHSFHVCLGAGTRLDPQNHPGRPETFQTQQAAIIRR